MSQKRSKKKRPRREDYMLNEQLKIEEGVFDERTMLRLRRFFTHNIISKLNFIIARGKESDVYLADPGSRIKEDFVIVKIFRLETSHFIKRIDYIRGDPRFGKIKTNIFDIVSEWCKKEYSNLIIASEANVHAPRPYYFHGNVLAMECISDGYGVAKTLKKSELKDPEKMLGIVLDDMKKLYSNDLVHSDISEYNILIKNDTPYMIDFGQAVVLAHPKANEFLQRDIVNILSYFRKLYNIERDVDKVYNYITKPAETT